MFRAKCLTTNLSLGLRKQPTFRKGEGKKETLAPKPLT